MAMSISFSSLTQGISFGQGIARFDSQMLVGRTSGTNESGDAEGVSLSEHLAAKLDSLSEEQAEANDAVSLLQSTSAELDSMADDLDEMSMLAEEYHDGETTAERRAEIQDEFDAIKARLAERKQFTDGDGEKVFEEDRSYSWTLSGRHDRTVTVDTALDKVDFQSLSLGSSAEESLSAIEEASLGVRSTQAFVDSAREEIRDIRSDLESYSDTVETNYQQVREVETARQIASSLNASLANFAATALFAQTNRFSLSAMASLV